MDNLLLRQNQRGVSLLEILISLFILAAGLFGLSSLQMASLKNVNNAQFHTIATTYAYDMAERMRSNKDGIENGAYDDIKSSVSKAPNCISDASTVCSSSEIAEYDGYIWNSQIKSDVNVGGLPSGEGTVLKDGSTYKITIKWKELQSNSAVNGDDATFILNVQI